MNNKLLVESWTASKIFLNNDLNNDIIIILYYATAVFCAQLY